MRLELQLKLKQTLAPQLIQSLKMLQMPILKLEQTLRHELATNPLLEEVDSQDTEQADEAPEFDVASEDNSQEDQVDPNLDKIDWDDYINDFEDHDYKIREEKEFKDDSFLATTAPEKTLYDHLLEQLSYVRLSEEEHQVGEYILGNINPAGYLVVTPEEMAQELKVTQDSIEKVLVHIKKFDPTGVGSSDLKESLLTQLGEKGLENSLAYRIVDEHLYDLEKKSILQVSKMMGVPFEKAQAALDVIKGLSPTPSHGRFDSAAATIIPDLVVERVGEDFVVFHNDRNLPRLRINPSYRQLVKKGAPSKDTKKYVSQKLEQARWLINSINQRRNTMIRVMEVIVNQQRDWFEKGIEFLTPLIMEDVARIVSMNVATISRVSNGKYVQTPHGVYEIKYFFNTGISRSDGGEISKRHVKKRIEEIITDENPEKPLSDQEIYRRLQDEGIKLARRTVTKYREESKILPARFRRRTS